MIQGHGMRQRRRPLAACVAAKSPLVAALVKEMRRARVSKSELARRMRTSRSLVQRLLDPGSDTSVPTLVAAAAAVGCALRIDLVQPAGVSAIR